MKKEADPANWGDDNEQELLRLIAEDSGEL